MDREGTGLLLVKGAKSGPVLRARLLQRHVVAHHADDVRLLLHGVSEIAGLGHVSLPWWTGTRTGSSRNRRLVCKTCGIGQPNPHRLAGTTKIYASTPSQRY